MVNRAVLGLIRRAEELSNNFGELLKQSSDVLAECQRVDEVMVNCCKFREDQLLKHLVEHINDQDHLKLLRENAELKQTVEEYQVGIGQIMAKYKEHCNSDVLSETYGLREQYINKLESIVKVQDKRIEQMGKLMQRTADLEEKDSVDNQRIISRLCGENEQMRRQLQISCCGSDGGFKLGLPPQSEGSTQVEHSDWDDSDSLTSFESFMTCLSSAGFQDLSTSSSTAISELDVNRFIEEALKPDGDGDGDGE